MPVVVFGTITNALQDGQESPVHRPVVHQARPDAKPHFEFTDKDAEGASTAKRPSSRHNDSMGLYTDNVTNEGDEGDGGETDTAKKPLGSMINVDLEHRRKDFGSQFEMVDDSPVPAARSTRAGAQGAAPAQPQLQRDRGEMPPPEKPLQQRPRHAPQQSSGNQNLARVVKSLDASWQNYDDSPDPVSKKENVPRSQAAADSAKYNNARHWGFGDEDV
jgi:hypothetical protein